MLKNRHYIPQLALIIILYLIVGALYAIYTPPWQAPDEPAHYNYVAHVAWEGCCPVIAPEDWDAAKLERLKASHFPGDADLTWVEYEDHQPPLYYLVASPVFDAADGNLVVTRLLSVLIGAGVVVAAYVAAARLFPLRRELALAVAVLVAFIPQHVAILASANNDAMLELLIGILLTVALGYVGNPMSPDYNGKLAAYDESHRPHAAAMGGFLGLIFLTKLTGYLPALAIVLTAIAWRWRIEGRPARWLIEQVVWGIGFGLMIGAIWWGRNSAVYGFPDVLGQAAHNTAVAGQLRTEEYVAKVGQTAYLRDYLTITYHSFWGQFGWMGVLMPARDYLLIGAFLLWAAAGLVLIAGPLRDSIQVELPQRAGAWILIFAAVATLAQFIYYNLTFVQFQGRYLYPALIPLAVAVIVGAWGWATWLRRWLPDSVAKWVPLIAVAWLPPFALWALFRYIVPNLH